MKKNNDKNPHAPQNDEKIHVTKSVLETAREQAAELEAQEQKMRVLIAEREKKQREEYDRKIMEERRELLRLKQGKITESEATIHEEPKEEIKLSFWGKIKNFFYHSKWWLGIASVFAVFVIFLAYNIITKERPDVVMLMIVNNNAIGYDEQLKNYLTSQSEDFNDNGEILGSVYYLPYTGDKNEDYANGVDGKLAIELESADGAILLGGELIYGIIEPELTLVNLEELYPDNPHVNGYRFMLKGTKFAEKLGIDPELVTDELYLAIRKPIPLHYAKLEDMQETYDKDFPVFEKIIADLSE